MIRGSQILEKWLKWKQVLRQQQSVVVQYVCI